jgi:hypothetical protein
MQNAKSRALTGCLLLSLGLAACGSVSTGGDGGTGGRADGGGGGRGGSGGGGSGTGGSGTGGSGTGGTAGGAGGGAGGSSGTGGAGGGCTYNGVTHAVGSTFPSSDGCNTCSCAAGGQVACTLRACPPDAGTDAAASCTLDTMIRYGQTGGNVAYENQATLAPPASYTYTRRGVRTDPIDLSCMPAFPPCNSATAVDVADIRRDLADADVQRAFAAATPPIYGRDDRPADGTLFQLLRGDGRGFLAGGACTAGATGCVPVPAGVARLVALLRSLDQQQLMDPSCAQLR